MAKIRLHQSIIYHGRLWNAGCTVEIDDADAEMLKSFGEVFDLPEPKPEPPKPVTRSTRSTRSKKAK